MALLLLFGIPVLATLFTVFINKRIRLELVVSRYGLNARARFWGFKLERTLAYDELLRLKSHIYKETASNNRLSLKRVLACVEVKRLYITSRIGIASDAFATVLLAGTMISLAQSIGGALRIEEGISYDILPVFQRNALWLYLEGIIILKPGKLMLTLIKQKLWEVRKNGASNRKHNGKNNVQAA